MAKGWSKIVLFGDSLTQLSFEPNVGCWGASIAHRMQRVADVYNRGFGGYSTSVCKLILPELLKDFKPEEVAVFTLLLGTNDSWPPPFKLAVPLSEYKVNLSDILTTVQNHGIEMSKVVVLCPPPCEVNPVVKEYAQACEETVLPFGVSCVNLYAEMVKCENLPDFFTDSVHFSEKGAQLVYNKIVHLIEEKVSSHRGSLTPNYPEYSDIDLNDPLKPFP